MHLSPQKHRRLLFSREETSGYQVQRLLRAKSPTMLDHTVQDLFLTHTDFRHLRNPVLCLKVAAQTAFWLFLANRFRFYSPPLACNKALLSKPDLSFSDHAAIISPFGLSCIFIWNYEFCEDLQNHLNLVVDFHGRKFCTEDFPKHNLILNYLMFKILHMEVVRNWVIFPMESTLL